MTVKPTCSIRGQSSDVPPGLYISRSNLIKRLAPSLLAAPFLALPSLPAGAAPAVQIPSLTRETADGLMGFLPALPPEPIAVPRKRLDITFAVLLMRSGYEAVDDLDFIPMDDFQKRFWLLRQSEWEPYKLQNSPLSIQQGDLADPLYFDFISNMQFVTILTSAIPAARQVFQEKCDPETEPNCNPEGTRMVTRAPEYQNNAALPALFEERVGDRIYDGLLNGFRGVNFGGPPQLPRSAPFADACREVQHILDIFVQRGYCISATLSDPLPNPTGRGGTFSVKVQGPAALWSLQAVAARVPQTGPVPVVYNAYDGLAVAAFLRASGYKVKCEMSWTDTTVNEKWSLS